MQGVITFNRIDDILLLVPLSAIPVLNVTAPITMIMNISIILLTVICAKFIFLCLHGIRQISFYNFYLISVLIFFTIIALILNKNNKAPFLPMPLFPHLLTKGCSNDTLYALHKSAAINTLKGFYRKHEHNKRSDQRQ